MRTTTATTLRDYQDDGTSIVHQYTAKPKRKTRNLFKQRVLGLIIMIIGIIAMIIDRDVTALVMLSIFGLPALLSKSKITY